MPKNANLPKRYDNLYVKRRLMKLEIDIFGIISNGLAHHTPRPQTMKLIRKEIQILTVHIGLDAAESNRIWYEAVANYNKISMQTFSKLRKITLAHGKSKDYEQALTQRRDVIYASIRAKIQNNDLIKMANQVMYDYEQRLKHDQLFGPEGILDQSRSRAEDGAASGSASSYSPFFLCSSHPNPAKDHADWEGKVYYDEDWEKYADEADQPSIRAYIRNHKLRSVQWVVGPPVFLTTRRNCRHYFKNIPMDQIMHGSARSILKKNHMYMLEKDEPVSRATLYYREYYNRLKTEEALYKLIPSEKLAQDITKDKKLLDKWKNMI